MKSKVSIIVAGVLLAVSPILAKVGGVSVDELINKDKFKEFEKVNKKVVENFLASRGQSNKVGKQEILHYNKKAVGRVYHLKPSGYVVATLNRNEVPIKAYSFSGNFDNLPEEYKEFLSARLYEYSEMIEEAEKTQVIDSEYKKIWSYLENYTESSPKPTIESNILTINSTEIPPELEKYTNQRGFHESDVFLNTTWGQGVGGADNEHSTYNRFTFIHPSLGSLGHTLVGCAPLAWGQIMKFHEWPLAPRGTTVAYDYEHNNITIPVSAQDLTDTTRYGSTATPNNEYLWNLMLNSVSDSQNDAKEAIGILLADIGYALHASWGISGTGAWTHGPNDALPEIEEHFGYSTNMRREVYLDGNNVYSSNEEVTYNAFVNSIKTDIDNRRPLLFGFNNGNYGHATVIDGYQNINYGPIGAVSFETHINFGWSGTDNDFYLFTQTPFINNDPIDPVGSLVEAVIVAGIQPCTNSANDCAPTFSGAGKQGLTLNPGWNLVSLIGNSDDLNEADFTDASAVYTYTNGAYDDTPIVKPRKGIWIYHNGTTEYVFPGSQTEAVELTSLYLTIALDFGSGEWGLIGTGRDITDNRIGTYFSDCKMYDRVNDEWDSCMPPVAIPAGTGFWAKRK